MGRARRAVEPSPAPPAIGSSLARRLDRTERPSVSGLAAPVSAQVIASAILDRILHHATTISIRGDSYRLKDKLKSGVVKPTTAGA